MVSRCALDSSWSLQSSSSFCSKGWYFQDFVWLLAYSPCALVVSSRVLFVLVVARQRVCWCPATRSEASDSPFQELSFQPPDDRQVCRVQFLEHFFEDLLGHRQQRRQLRFRRESVSFVVGARRVLMVVAAPCCGS